MPMGKTQWQVKTERFYAKSFFYSKHYKWEPLAGTIMLPLCKNDRNCFYGFLMSWVLTGYYFSLESSVPYIVWALGAIASSWLVWDFIILRVVSFPLHTSPEQVVREAWATISLLVCFLSGFLLIPLL